MEESIVSRAGADLFFKVSGFRGDNLGRPPRATNVYCSTRRGSPALRSACRGRGLMACHDCLETLEYIPMNPVRRGLVKRAEERKGSSVRDYAGAALALLVTCHS